jgi:hypothetical protein
VAGEPADWLSFAPRHTSPRRSQSKVLGAHAFRTGPRSLCGSIARAAAGGPASDEARRCVWCERVIKGVSPDRSGASNEVAHGE